jgi:hypothetical protein
LRVSGFEEFVTLNPKLGTAQARLGSRLRTVPRSHACTHARMAAQARSVKPFLSFLDALAVHVAQGGKVIQGPGEAFARSVPALLVYPEYNLLHIIIDL